MAATSFKPEAEVFSASLLPAQWTFNNYVQAWNAIPMARMLSNSMLVAVSQTLLRAYKHIGGVCDGAVAIQGSRLIYGMIALTWLVPFQVIMIPNYVVISGLGWRDSLMGLIVPNIVSAFAILRLYHAFKSYPKALIEAAHLDGATDWGVLWRTMIPNLRSSIASIGILLFITVWNDYFWPALVTTKLENSTVQKGLQMFISSDANMWGPLMAATTIASFPVLAIYLVLQRQIIDSFVKGGLK